MMNSTSETLEFENANQLKENDPSVGGKTYTKLSV
jgi:hypothetical protein